MSASIDKIIAELKADGITISTRLVNPSVDSPFRRIGEAAQRAGIAYCAECKAMLPAGQVSPCVNCDPMFADAEPGEVQP